MAILKFVIWLDTLSIYCCKGLEYLSEHTKNKGFTGGMASRTTFSAEYDNGRIRKSSD